MEYYLRTDKVEIDDHGIATVKMALNICNCPKDDCNKDRYKDAKLNQIKKCNSGKQQRMKMNGDFAASARSGRKNAKNKLIELAKTKHCNNFFEAAFNTNDIEILTPILVTNPSIVKEHFDFNKSNKDVFTNAGFIYKNSVIGNHQIHSKPLYRNTLH